MANRFANTANLFLTSIFFTPLIPFAPIVALFGMIFAYWVDKWMLLRRHKRPEELAGFMAQFFAGLLPYFTFLYALSHFLYIRRLQKEYDEDPANVEKIGEENYVFTPLIGLIIVGVYILFPVRSIINKCVGENEGLLNVSPYDDNYLQFLSDYDRENPVTQRQGEMRLLEAQMQKDSGGQLSDDEKKHLEQTRQAIQGASVFDAMKAYTQQRDARQAMQPRGYGQSYHIQK